MSMIIQFDSREELLAAVFWTVSIGLKRLDRAGIAGYIARVLSIKLLNSWLHGLARRAGRWTTPFSLSHREVRK
jgi:hypothetical protein